MGGITNTTWHNFDSSLILSRKRLKLAGRETLSVPLLSLLKVDDAPNGVQILHSTHNFFFRQSIKRISLQ